MATAENATGTDTGNLVIGKVVILYGHVKAISSDGTERVLAVNSPVFTYDRVITESDGMVSIAIDDAAATHIDLGRMSDVVIDEDIFAGISAEEVSEAAAEVEQIQEALLAEDFDPTTELEAPAAGGPASAGGGHPVPEFVRVTHEGEVTSGAETTGITTDTVEAIEGAIVEGEPPVNDSPVAADDSDSTLEDTPVTVDVTGNDHDVDGTIVSWTLESQPANGTVVNNGDGTFTYTPGQDYNGSDSFTYSVMDDDGATSNVATVSIDIGEVNDPPAIIVTGDNVHEKGLPDGTEPTSGADSAEGSFSPQDADAADTIDTLSIIIDGTNTFALDGTSNVIGSVSKGAGTLYIKGDGTWKFELDNNVYHDSNDSNWDPADEHVTYAVTVKDSSGSESSSQDLTFTIDDDIVQVGEVSNGIIANTATPSSPLTLEGVLDVIGADTTVGATASFSALVGSGTFADSGLTSSSVKVYYYVDPTDPDTVTAYKSTTAVEYDGSQSVVFTLTVDPTNDSFTLNTYDILDGKSTFEGNFAKTDSGQPVNYLIATDADGDGIAEFTRSDAPPSGDYLFDLHADPISEQVNGSAVGWGVGNNTVNIGETLVVDFNDPVVRAVMTFDEQHYDPGDVHWEAYANDSATTPVAYGTFLGTGNADDPLIIDSIGSIAMIKLSVETDASKFRLLTVTGEQITSTEDVSVDLPVTIHDSDNDQTDTTIHLTFDNYGDCKLDGTPDNDVIVGGSDGEKIVGGGGDDIIFAGGGNDTIYVNDGDANPDYVDGGDGYDTSYADNIDSLVDVEDPNIS